MKLDVLTEEQRKFIEETGPAKLYAIIYDLTDQLSAERTRRLKAEEAISWYYAHCGGDPSDPSFKYFAQYPRVEEAGDDSSK